MGDHLITKNQKDYQPISAFSHVLGNLELTSCSAKSMVPAITSAEKLPCDLHTELSGLGSERNREDLKQKVKEANDIIALMSGVQEKAEELRAELLIYENEWQRLKNHFQKIMKEMEITKIKLQLQQFHIETSSQEGAKDDSKAIEKNAQQRTAVESDDFMPIEALRASSSQEGEKDDSKAIEKKAQQRTAVESEDFMPTEAVRASSSQEGEKDDSKAVEKKAQQRTAVESEDFMPVEATSSREGEKDDSKAVEKKAQQRTAVEYEDFMPTEAVRALQNESMLSEVVLTQHLIRMSHEGNHQHQLQSLNTQLGRYLEETDIPAGAVYEDVVIETMRELQNESMLSEVVLTQHLIRISHEGNHQLQSLIRQLGECQLPTDAVREDEVVGTVSEAPTVDGCSPLLGCYLHSVSTAVKSQ